MMLKRLILGLNGLFALVNGAFMMAASEAWFAAVAAYTGPFNVHLVQDVGAAFIVSGLSLFACLWRPSAVARGYGGRWVLVCPRPYSSGRHPFRAHPSPIE